MHFLTQLTTITKIPTTAVDCIFCDSNMLIFGEFAILLIIVLTHPHKIGLSYQDSLPRQNESFHDFSLNVILNKIERILIILFSFPLMKINH